MNVITNCREIYVVSKFEKNTLGLLLFYILFCNVICQKWLAAQLRHSWKLVACSQHNRDEIRIKVNYICSGNFLFRLLYLLRETWSSLGFRGPFFCVHLIFSFQMWVLSTVFANISLYNEGKRQMPSIHRSTHLWGRNEHPFMCLSHHDLNRKSQTVTKCKIESQQVQYGNCIKTMSHATPMNEIYGIM